MNIEIGGLALQVGPSWAPFEAAGADRQIKKGKQRGGLLTSSDGAMLEVSLRHWADDTREIVGTNLMGGPVRYAEIIDRHLMSVRTVGRRLSVEISLTTLTVTGRASKPQCSLAQWNAAVGLDVVEVLNSYGVLGVDTREVLEKDDGRRRNYLCAIFEPENEIAPFAIWMLARAVPVYRQHGLMGGLS